MDREKQIIEVENRLGLVLVIAVFFPTFLITLGVSSGNANQWSSLVATYIAAYCFFQIFKKKIGNSSLRWINRAVLLGMVLYIQPIFLFSTLINQKVGWLNYSSLMLSLWALPFVAALVLVLIFMGWIRGIIDERALKKMIT